MESEDLLDYLDVCLDFIEKSRKEGAVLVHCFAGVSRRYDNSVFFFNVN
jgi:dual specificity phosphatase 12